MTNPLDRSNLQSIVFQSHPCAHSRHFLFRCGDKAGAKHFLAEWTPRVTRGEFDPKNPPCPIVIIAVSWPGLDKLGAFDGLGGVDEAAKAFPSDLKTPPAAALLGAYGESAPENWWNKRFKSQDIDLTVHIYCTGPEQFAESSEKLRESARRHDLEELIPTQDGEALTGQVLGAGIPGLRKLHFGYSDGFSQLQVNWDSDPALGTGPPLNGKG